MKYLPHILVVCFCMILSTSFAQNKAEYNYAYSVFNKLVKTINQSTPAKPQLVIINSDNVIAKTNNNGEITVGSGLIIHCRSFGKDSANALAHILAHELTHYYSNHFWTENFGSSYADLDWGSLIETSGKTLSSMKLYETQADEYGMYYAFAAGYKTLQIGSQVLDSIYSWYKLEEQIPGYPSLLQRKTIAIDAKKNILRLIPSFETGNLLLTLAQVYGGEQQSMLAQLSGYYYDDILANKIQTKELYNNSGLTKVLQVLQYFSDSIQQIHFPFMLESKSMLYSNESTRGDATENDSQTIALMENNLEEAESLFSNAIKIDKNFYPAYINLAIVSFLKEKYGTASDYLSNASSIMGEKHSLIWAVYEMEAIVEHTKNITKMQTLFAEAIDKGSSTAYYNLQLLSHKIDRLGISQQTKDIAYFTSDTNEYIYAVPAFEYLDKLTANRAGRIDIQNEKAVLYTDTLADYIVYYIRPSTKPAPNKLRFIVSKTSSNLITSTGLKNGLNSGDLEKTYGKPTSIILESEASIWVYPTRNLFVWVEEGVVKKWGYWWII